jgi:hypothetical protein
VESGIDYVKAVQKITKFEFCAACQGHFLGISVYFHKGLNIKLNRIAHVCGAVGCATMAGKVKLWTDFSYSASEITNLMSYETDQGPDSQL